MAILYLCNTPGCCHELERSNVAEPPKCDWCGGTMKKIAQFEAGLEAVVKKILYLNQEQQ